GVVDALADAHADRPADGTQEDAVGGQPAEARQRQVAGRLDADDQVPDGPADEAAAEEPLAKARRGAVAEDPEQHPAEQPAEGAEDGVVIDADEQRHDARNPWRGRETYCTFVTRRWGDCNGQSRSRRSR